MGKRKRKIKRERKKERERERERERDCKKCRMKITLKPQTRHFRGLFKFMYYRQGYIALFTTIKLLLFLTKKTLP